MARQRLRIPDSQRQGFGRLVRLEPDALARVIENLAAVEPTLDLDLVAESVSSAAHLPAAEARDIVNVLFGLYLTRLRRQATPAGFAEEVCRAAEATGESELRPRKGSWDRFREQLTKLLALESSLGLSAKATEVSTDFDRYFCEARILTDLRPIFGGEPTAGPEAAVIVHTLRISYHDGDTLKRFFVALDGSDLARLKAVIARAEAKQEGLHAVAARSGLRVLRARPPA